MHRPDSIAAAGGVQCVYVLSDIDGVRYKLVTEGDVRELSAEKVKRYLQRATGLAPAQQALTLRGRPVPDSARGGDVDLRAGDTLRLRHTAAEAKAEAEREAEREREERAEREREERAEREREERAEREREERAEREREERAEREREERAERERERERERGEAARLAERLAEAERRLANAQPDWRLREELQAQRAAVARLERERDEAQRAAAAQWGAKEEELVRELDLLREERRRARREEEERAKEQRVVVHTLEGQIRALQEELRRENCVRCVWDVAQANLRELSRTLGLAQPLQFDSNDTCALPVGSDEVSVLVTLDEPSARVFMYATIASALPVADDSRLRLYEALLEGALLGRETAGAGVGVCREDGLVIMSIAIDVAHADDGALAAVAEPFIAAARLWAEKVVAIAEEEI